MICELEAEEEAPPEEAVRPERTIGTVYAMTGLDCQPKYWVEWWGSFVRWNERNIVAAYNREQPEADWSIHYHHSEKRFANMQRSEAARECRGDWLFFVDTDMVFPVDVLGGMLTSMDVITQTHGQCDVLTGLYVHRDATRVPLVYRYQSDLEYWPPVLDFPWDRPFRVDGSGAGLLLIRRQALDAVHQRFGFGKAFDMLPKYDTEDLCFFLRCYELGFAVWCDPRIQAAHAYTAFAWPEDWPPLAPDALEEADRKGLLHQPVGDSRWVSVEQAAALCGRGAEDIAVAIANLQLTARHTEGQPTLVEVAKLMEWHHKGAL